MKKFLKKNLAMIIFLGILLVAGTILGIAIYRVSSRQEPTIIIKDNIILSYSGSEKEIDIEKTVVSISTSAFEGKSTIEKVNFLGESNLKSIGPRAFQECGSLKVIVLPKGLETIGAHAFDSCTSLETIIIPEGVKSIDDFAFSNCKNLKSISLPSTLESLGEEVFKNCSSLETITNKSLSYTFEEGALYNSEKTVLYKYLATNAQTSFVVPETVKEVKANAFQDAENLTSIVVGANVEKMGLEAFSGCVNLYDLTIPFLGTTAAAADGSMLGAFFDEVPDSLKIVTVLGGEIVPLKAFDFCGKIQKIVIGEGVTEIGESSFKQCSSLTRVELPSTIKYISAGAFKNCNKNCKIYINQVEKDFGTDWNPAGLQVIFTGK